MRKYITELIGTFFLVFTVGFMVLPGSSNPEFAALAIGGMLMVMIYAGGHVSGAHYNPAVTLALFLRGKCTAQDMPWYMGAQFIGGALAALLVSSFQGTPVDAPAAVDVMKALSIEVIFTFALAYVVLNVATSSDIAGNQFYGLAIGFTVVAAAYAGGGGYNPAVGIGLGLMKLKAWADIWIFIVGPLAGGALAAFVYRFLNPDEFRK